MVCTSLFSHGSVKDKNLANSRLFSTTTQVMQAYNYYTTHQVSQVCVSHHHPRFLIQMRLTSSKAGAYLSMLFCNTWPRQTFLPLFLGSLSEAIGVGLMAWALYFEKKGTIFAMMAVTGAGTGLRMLPGSLHAIGFFPDHVATVVSLMAVAMPFGGTLALTIMSTVFNNTSGAANGLESVDFDDPVAAKVC